MKYKKQILIMIVAMIIMVGFIGNVEADAKDGLAVPKITVKTTNKRTGVNISVDKNKNAEGYEVLVTGSAKVNKDYRIRVDINGTLQEADKITVAEYINEDGKAKRSIKIKYLPEGSYKVKVRSVSTARDGSITYSNYCKEKTFKLKSQKSNGYTDKYDFSKVKKFDEVKFGAFEQDFDYTNGKEPIEWIVLDKTKESIVLMSKYTLDYLPYNVKDTAVTWESCSLRKWLNKMFIDEAFNKTEQGMLKTSKITNKDNPVFNIPGGKDTKDKVYLLSLEDVTNPDYGFSDDYNVLDDNRGCSISQNKFARWCYWLRTPGETTARAMYVTVAGRVYPNGDVVNSFENAVHPVICIDIKS